MFLNVGQLPWATVSYLMGKLPVYPDPSPQSVKGHWVILPPDCRRSGNFLHDKHLRCTCWTWWRHIRNTGPLLRESTGGRCIPLTKGQQYEALMHSFLLLWTSTSINRFPVVLRHFGFQWHQRYEILHILNTLIMHIALLVLMAPLCLVDSPYSRFTVCVMKVFIIITCCSNDFDKGKIIYDPLHDKQREKVTTITFFRSLTAITDDSTDWWVNDQNTSCPFLAVVIFRALRTRNILIWPRLL